MLHRIPITIRLDHFEGPLDLLLYLIQSHELHISKISITKITDQYLHYVRLMQELNFDIASEFLLMASTLLYWKSRALLPQDSVAHQTQEQEMEEFTQEDLIRQLLERRKFFAAGEDLRQLPLLGQDVFVRSQFKQKTKTILKEMSLTDLCLSYQEMFSRSKRRSQILKKETISLTDKVLEFCDHLLIGKLTLLEQMLSDKCSRPELIVTFLAALELTRLKKMRLYQEGTYAPIYLELLETLKNLDTQLLTGFITEATDGLGKVEAQAVLSSFV